MGRTCQAVCKHDIQGTAGDRVMENRGEFSHHVCECVYVCMWVELNDGHSRSVTVSLLQLVNVGEFHESYTVGAFVLNALEQFRTNVMDVN